MMDGRTEALVQQAHRLVDHVIESAIRKLQADGISGGVSGEVVGRQATVGGDSVRFDLSRDTTFVYREPPPWEEYDIENIQWLNIDDFSVEQAEEKIHEYIKTWDYQDSWQYCVDYLGADDHEYDIRHRFRARWSIPTRRKPIPRATASVYFTFDVSKIKPKNYPVDVYFVFETNSLVHRPGQSRFREKWLKDIVENKVLLMDMIDF